MKNSIIKYIYIFSLILLFAWIIPASVKFITYRYDRYPMIYFSSLEKEFMINSRNEYGIPVYQDTKGKKYQEKQFHQLQPMLYYKQLVVDGSLPDSINGLPISSEFISLHSFIFRYKPKEKNTPNIALYPLYESESGKVNLEDPSDMFRIHNKIEFVDSKSNEIEKEKSSLFTQKMIDAQYGYPSQWIVGIPYAKKPFDDGYFTLDSKNELYQIKLVKGIPFVKNTNASTSIQIKYFLPISVKDHSLLGFVVGQENQLYAMNRKAYKLTKIINNFNVDKDRLTIFGNPFYWTIWVDSQNGRHAYAYDINQEKIISTYTTAPQRKIWDTIRRYIFPFVVELNHPNNNFIYPILKDYSAVALIFNLFLVIFFFCWTKYKKGRTGIHDYIQVILILFGGIFAFIAVLLGRHAKYEN